MILVRALLCTRGKADPCIDAGQGSILFGGVDSTKYTGDLSVLPLQVDPDENIIHSFLVTFVGLEVDGNGGSSVYSANTSVLTLLDSATSVTYVPVAMFNAILTGLGAVNTTSGYLVPCGLATTQGVVKFKFGNAEAPVIIAAPISQFVLPPEPGLSFSNGDAACGLGISPQDEEHCIFGETFLRGAYVVYNIDGNEVAIANTNFNATAPASIVQITATNSIPGASSTASGSATQTGSDVGSPTGASVYPDNVSVFTQTATSALWNLGTTASSGTSTGKKGAAAGLSPPPTSFLGAIFAGVSVLFGLLGGSMIVLM
jgi:Eukaryotic aspartyl protease